MKDKLLCGSIGTILSAIGTTLQPNDILETISLIITIIGGLITFIVMPLISWYKKSKDNDGKISNDEVQEVIKIITNGSEKIKDQVDNNEKGTK